MQVPEQAFAPPGGATGMCMWCTLQCAGAAGLGVPLKPRRRATTPTARRHHGKPSSLVPATPAASVSTQKTPQNCRWRLKAMAARSDQLTHGVASDRFRAAPCPAALSACVVLNLHGWHGLYSLTNVTGILVARDVKWSRWRAKWNTGRGAMGEQCNAVETGAHGSRVETGAGCV